MLRQAKELYSGRPGIRLDYEHLKKGMELDLKIQLTSSPT